MQVAVKVMAVYDVAQSPLAHFKEGMVSLQAVQACSRAYKFFGYCIKQQQLCLIMQRYNNSLMTEIEGGSQHTDRHVIPYKHTSLELIQVT